MVFFPKIFIPWNTAKVDKRFLSFSHFLQFFPVENMARLIHVYTGLFYDTHTRIFHIQVCCGHCCFLLVIIAVLLFPIKIWHKTRPKKHFTLHMHLQHQKMKISRTNVIHSIACTESQGHHQKLYKRTLYY